MAKRPSTQYNTYPAHVTGFVLPNDPKLKRVYDIYKPSIETLKLQSEQGRSLYAEAFIENNLGTLAYLCVRVLARSFGPRPTPIVASDPVLLQVHNDALDVDLPLSKCYFISDDCFWKRVVLTKHQDKSFAVKSNVNWKELGISLKYAELVEECPVEYWSEEEMKELALKVKEFVREMHINRLQSLKEHSFEKYFRSELESSTEESEDESSDDDSESLITASEIEEYVDAEKTTSQLELAIEMAKLKAQSERERQQLREDKQKAREAKKAKRKRRVAIQATNENPKKKVAIKIPDNVFDIEISESEDDGEDLIIDKRNKALLLQHMKKYKYPAKDCHHIDLRFVQYFTNLKIFVIEFCGPIQNCYYHVRHRNFSHDDIKYLAIGLSQLPKLHTFRLRNSRMDAEKLMILCRTLGALTSLETLDFGNDQLQDDCGSAFDELFRNTKTLRYLELETNCFGEQVLCHLGKSLQNYKANELFYLGLARNPITDKALHILVSDLIGTKHVTQLNIRGINFATEMGLCCCIANELLRQHPSLLKLDICAIKVSPLAADEIIKSLNKNVKLLEFYCSGCELDEESEIDINVLIHRNKYIAENYFLGDTSITTAEIEKWLSRTRNPILLKVLTERETQNQYLREQSDKMIPPTVAGSLDLSRHESFDIVAQMYERPVNMHFNTESVDAGQAPEHSEHFVYAANEFDEREFLEHVFQPGPQERYYYFKMCKDKYSIKENVKNISMI